MPHRIARNFLVFALAAAGFAGCNASGTPSRSADGGWGPWTPPTGGGGSGSGSGVDAGASSDAGSGSFGGVGVGGGQDFAAFRKAIADGKIPASSTLDATGFFAEHYTSLPAPTCGKTFCLHGMLSVSNDLARGGDWTLLQMAMNSPIDPATVKKPPLDLAVVLDRSGSMAAAGKMEYAKSGVKLLVDALGPSDVLTFLSFDDRIEAHFGPAVVTDKEALKAVVDAIAPRGATNIHGGLEAGYRATLSVGDETQQRRVIFLTDGLATAGVTDPAAIRAMSAGYNERYVGLTTIGLGSDVDTALLRGLAEVGGGNFYFVERPEAVTEVFTEELAYFVAPIAYDLTLTFTELPSYALKHVHGTNLWKPILGGGSLHVPSVFLVSRTSSMPGPGGGRRGGGAAIIAELGASMMAPADAHDVAKLHLEYRMPGSTTRETQDVDVASAGVAGVAPDGGFYQNRGMEKNTLVLGFFVAFRDATLKAENDRRGALDLLTAFQTRMSARLEGWTDEDLLDDMKILQSYIGILQRAVGP